MSMTFGAMAEVNVGMAAIERNMDTKQNDRLSAQREQDRFATRESDEKQFMTEKSEAESRVVRDTLEVINRKQNHGASGADFDFQQGILGAAYGDKGRIISGLV